VCIDRYGKGQSVTDGGLRIWETAMIHALPLLLSLFAADQTTIRAYYGSPPKPLPGATIEIRANNTVLSVLSTNQAGEATVGLSSLSVSNANLVARMKLGDGTTIQSPTKHIRWLKESGPPSYVPLRLTTPKGERTLTDVFYEPVAKKIPRSHYHQVARVSNTTEVAIVYEVRQEVHRLGSSSTPYYNPCYTPYNPCYNPCWDPCVRWCPTPATIDPIEKIPPRK